MSENVQYTSERVSDISQANSEASGYPVCENILFSYGTEGHAKNVTSHCQNTFDVFAHEQLALLYFGGVENAVLHAASREALVRRIGTKTPPKSICKVPEKLVPAFIFWIAKLIVR